MPHNLWIWYDYVVRHMELALASAHPRTINSRCAANNLHRSYSAMNTKEALFAVGQEKVLAAPQLYIDVDIEADGIAGYGTMLSMGAPSPTGERCYRKIRPYSENFLSGHR